MKKKDLYTNLQSLDSVSNLKGLKFAGAVLKNKKNFENEIILLEEVIKPNPIYTEFEKKRITLCEVHAEKDVDGKPVIIGDKYKLVDINLFNNELDRLKNIYQDVIDERVAQINKYNALLEINAISDIIKVNFNELPEDISAKQIESIDFMVLLD